MTLAARLRIPPHSYYLFVTLYVSSLAILVPGLLALGFSEYRVAEVMLPFAALYAALGALFKRVFEPSRSMRLDDAIIAAVSAWILVPLLNAIPVSLSIGVPFIDTWFEAVSGFTTTGLTMFTGSVDSFFKTYVPAVEELPKSILFWRSFIQWLGGIGILVLFAAFAAGGGIPSHLIGLAEGRYEHMEPSIARSIRAFIYVYSLLTLVGTILLYASGVRDVFEALNHAMTGIATGGFSFHSNSFAYYNSVTVEAAAVVIMVFGALNFADQYSLYFKGNASRLINNPETYAFATILAVLVAFGTLILALHGYEPLRALRYTVFQVVSAVSGTGFQTMDLGRAPDDYKLMLTVASLLGGSIISTTGGIKMFRLVMISSSLKWVYEEFTSVPGRVVVRKVGGRIVGVSELQQAVAVVSMFVGAWLTGTIALYIILPDAGLASVGFEVASALGNVGLSTGLTGASMPLAAKIVLIAEMTAGRLEIIPYILAVMAAVTQLRLLLARRRRQRLLKLLQAARGVRPQHPP